VPNYTYTSDPDSALKNKLGAKTFAALELAEAKFVFARMVGIGNRAGNDGSFGASHLKAIHYHLFQDVYEWAGHTRDEPVLLSDGTVATEPFLRKPDGNFFVPAPRIKAALRAIEDDLRAGNFLRGLPRHVFAARAADSMSRLNALHPFREGNGRTQRVFMQELAAAAGHQLDFSVVSRERMIRASSVANDDGDAGMMRRLFDEISDPVRIAALEPAIEFLSRQGFDWNNRYISTAEPGHAVELVFSGVAGGHFIARTDASIVIGQRVDLPSTKPDRGERFLLNPSRWR